MLGYKAAKAAAIAKAKKRDVPERDESLSEEVEDEVPLKRNHTGTPTAPRVPEADPALNSSPLVAITLPSPAHTSPPPAAPASASTSSTKVQERCSDLQRPSLDSLLGHRPEIFLDYLRAPSPSREVTAALPPPLRDSANLLTRSWGVREQGFLNEMPIGEALVTAQLHGHRSILYMIAVTDKVFSLLHFI